VKEQLKPFLTEVEEDLEVFHSPTSHFRRRCRFQLLSVSGDWNYVMWEGGSVSVRVRSFPLASRGIHKLMPILLQYLNTADAFLVRGLTAVNFLEGFQQGQCQGKYQKDRKQKDKPTEKEPELEQQTLEQNEIEESKKEKEEENEIGELTNIIVTLIYSLPLNKDLWTLAAQDFKKRINNDNAMVNNKLHVELVGKSKGTSLVVDRADVVDTFRRFDDRVLYYKQVEGSFSNPNAVVNVCVLNWLCKISKKICSGEEGARASLLELYCGSGNHTVALSPYFESVTAVEIDPSLCSAASHNLALNNVTNSFVIQANSRHFCRDLFEKYTKRVSESTPDIEENTENMTEDCTAECGSNNTHISTDSSSTSTTIQTASSHTKSDANSNVEKTQNNTRKSIARQERKQRGEGGGVEGMEREKRQVVLVDPPRSGLDDNSLMLVKLHDNVLYVSCSVDALARDLSLLSRSHLVRRLAVFDQFAFTPHVECAAWLCRKRMVDF